MAEHDLTQKIIPYLDRHLAFPLLDYLYETNAFPEEQLWAAQYQLAQGTNMIDYALDIFKKLHPDQEQPEGKAISVHIFYTTSPVYRFCCQKREFYFYLTKPSTRGANSIGCY